MNARFLMIVPYMLVRKPLATPRESTDEGSALLMNCLNMLVQIGFLEFKVIENEKQSSSAIYCRDKSMKRSQHVTLQITPLKMSTCSHRRGI
jgi:hypothetical protein